MFRDGPCVTGYPASQRHAGRTSRPSDTISPRLAGIPQQDLAEGHRSFCTGDASMASPGRHAADALRCPWQRRPAHQPFTGCARSFLSVSARGAGGNVPMPFADPGGGRMALFMVPPVTAPPGAPSCTESPDAPRPASSRSSALGRCVQQRGPCQGCGGRPTSPAPMTGLDAQVQRLGQGQARPQGAKPAHCLPLGAYGVSGPRPYGVGQAVTQFRWIPRRADAPRDGAYGQAVDQGIDSTLRDPPVHPPRWRTRLATTRSAHSTTRSDINRRALLS